MYKVAIIQNDSEMMRYSWSDIRPMVDKIGYSYDSYTSSNLKDIFPKLLRYDAIIIASNACNDRETRNILNSNEASFVEFFQKGGGLFASFQNKKGENEFYDFLPEQ